LKNPITKNWAEGVAQGESPGFKPQYHKKPKNTSLLAAQTKNLDVIVASFLSYSIHFQLSENPVSSNGSKYIHKSATSLLLHCSSLDLIYYFIAFLLLPFHLAIYPQLRRQKAGCK
jgi:hypothetical protein